MVNPLARVVMNNVVKKTNPNSNTSLKNKGKQLNLEKLDAIAGSISAEKKVNNLTNKEQDLIIDVINGETKIKEEKHTATMLTLDEAVERIKGSR